MYIYVINKSAAQSISSSINQLINRSSNQSSNQWINEYYLCMMWWPDIGTVPSEQTSVSSSPIPRPDFSTWSDGINSPCVTVFISTVTFSNSVIWQINRSITCASTISHMHDNNFHLDWEEKGECIVENSIPKARQWNQTIV